MRTPQQQLEDVDAAIRAVETGAQQSVTALGVTVTRANLAVLYAERQRLEGVVAAASLPGEVPAMMPVALGRIG